MQKSFLSATLANYLRFLTGRDLNFLQFIDQLSVISTHEAFDNPLFEKLITLVTSDTQSREKELNRLRVHLDTKAPKKSSQATALRTGEIKFEDKLLNEIEQLKNQTRQALEESRYPDAIAKINEAIQLSQLHGHTEEFYQFQLFFKRHIGPLL